MSNLGNKATMAKNIQYYMDLRHKTRNDMCEALGVKYTTFTDWVKGNTYPRIDKIELMANYFGIEKSDLVEERSKQTPPPAHQDIEQLLIDHYGFAAEGMLLYSKLDIEDRAEIKGEMRQMMKSPKYTTTQKSFTREDLNKALSREHTQERQREA